LENWLRQKSEGIQLKKGGKTLTDKYLLLIAITKFNPFTVRGKTIYLSSIPNNVS
jgi:hypothetical protein